MRKNRAQHQNACLHLPVSCKYLDSPTDRCAHSYHGHISLTSLRKALLVTLSQVNRLLFCTKKVRVAGAYSDSHGNGAITTLSCYTFEFPAVHCGEISYTPITCCLLSYTWIVSSLGQSLSFCSMFIQHPKRWGLAMTSAP